MPQKYQEWDEGFFDYDIYPLFGENLRGPAPNLSKPTIAFIGAAQTFGRLATKSFPSIVGQNVGTEVLNLGVGGKGPSFFSQEEEMLSAINQCSVAVVQVMSGRSVSNSYFQVLDGGCISATSDATPPQTAEAFYDALLKRKQDIDVGSLLDDARRFYVAEMSSFLDLITPPKILFWFAVRSPDLPHPDLWSAHGMLDVIKRGGATLGTLPEFELRCGCFPHFIDRATLNKIIPHCDQYVECVTSRGLPDITWRGARARWNNYYPSDAMHRVAANSLIPVCRDLLN